MKKLFYILFCFSLAGCSDPEPQKPANLLRQEKMVQILADIHTVEAQVERAILYPDTALMTFNHYQEEVLEKHDVTNEEFRTTYRYYLRNLDEMNKLYEVVIDTLSLREIKAARQANADLNQLETNIDAPAVTPDTVAVPDSAAVADTLEEAHEQTPE
ncbi:DUF4296 domain-containing protein [Botryobacter ruber]|uniref:DUF4296 domain-containing protein n=1 Tax=Botryobacter ruber TaxID=2171629 RepID=UPI001F0C2455|nr:DUF4296 domain-containing protein [Botryobacter ruber]